MFWAIVTKVKQKSGGGFMGVIPFVLGEGVKRSVWLAVGEEGPFSYLPNQTGAGGYLQAGLV